MYSNAAPSHVHVPWPTPTRKCSPLPVAHPLDLLVEPRGGLRGVVGKADGETVAVGPRPGVLSKRSAGPVALMRKS